MALKKLLPLVTLLSCLVVLVPIAAFSVVGNRAPDNVLMPDGASGPVQLVSSTFVQGWGFFTRDPTENRTVIYFENEAGVWEKSTLDDPKPTDVNFGLSRVRRAYLADLALILESADRDGAKFIPCEVADGSPTQGCSLDAEKVTVQLQTPPRSASVVRATSIGLEVSPDPVHIRSADNGKAKSRNQGSDQLWVELLAWHSRTVPQGSSSVLEPTR